MSQLCKAVRSADPDAVNLILAQNPQAINEVDEKGYNALYWAASGAGKILDNPLYSESDEVCVKRDAIWNTLRNIPGAKVMCSNVEDTLYYAAISFKIELVERLVKDGADINTTFQFVEGLGNGANMLHIACSLIRTSSDRLIPFIKGLLALGINKDLEDSRGNTALHYAFSHHEVFDLILDSGATFDIHNKDGNTVLHWAARSGNVKAVKSLLAKNARATLVNGEGKTAIDIARETGHHEIELLLDSSLNPEQDIFYAARGGKTALVEKLIKEGADVNGKDKDGHTILYYASLSWHEELMIAILKHRPSNVELPDKDNSPLLHRAIQLDKLQLAEALMDAGASKEAMDIYENIALHIALIYRKEGLARKLIDETSGELLRGECAKKAFEFAVNKAPYDIAYKLLKLCDDLGVLNSAKDLGYGAGAKYIDELVSLYNLPACGGAIPTDDNIGSAGDITKDVYFLV